VTPSPAIAEELARQLAALGWVSDLLVGGSLATGDYVPGVSDLDLVAVVVGPVDRRRQDVLSALHRRLDSGAGTDLKLGCVYADSARLVVLEEKHPTWTHGQLVQRTLSGIARAELVRHGYSILGRSPLEILPEMSDDEVRAAARAEITGYWAATARRPTVWLNTAFADLGLTSMARGRHTLATGALLTKTEAIEQADAPSWLIDQVRARRQGKDVASPRVRTALIAWRDARRTVAGASQPAGTGAS
jgi:hypothetical protein